MTTIQFTNQTIVSGILDQISSDKKLVIHSETISDAEGNASYAT